MPKAFMEWVSEIDSRTTVICLDANGQVVEAHELFVTMAGSLTGPPAHYGCRSIIDLQVLTVSTEVTFRDRANSGRRFDREERRAGKRAMSQRRKSVGKERWAKELERARRTDPPPGIPYLSDVRSRGPIRLPQLLADDLGSINFAKVRPPTVDALSDELREVALRGRAAAARAEASTSLTAADIEQIAEQMRMRALRARVEAYERSPKVTWSMPDSSDAKFAEKRLQAWIDDPAVQQTLKELSVEYGYDNAKDFVIDVVAAWRDWIAKSKVSIRVPGTQFNSILSQGRFKSQFETGRSKGLFNPEKRAKAEFDMFGLPTNLPVEQRPIYGYLDDAGKKPLVDQYGDVTIYLKDSVRNRTTWTGDDSLDWEGMTQWSSGIRKKFGPSPVNDPHPGSIWWFHVEEVKSGSQYYTAETAAKAKSHLFDPSTYRKGFYQEVQIHGGVSVDDIQEVLFTSTVDEATLNRYAKLQTKLDKLGIPWRISLD